MCRGRSPPRFQGREHLKGTDGEIALRLGENDEFGLINVGDASAICKLCDQQDELVVTEMEFSGSLCRVINDSESTVNLLIGSKKFTEGWNISFGDQNQLHALFWRLPL